MYDEKRLCKYAQQELFGYVTTAPGIDADDVINTVHNELVLYSPETPREEAYDIAACAFNKLVDDKWLRVDDNFATFPNR